ncbi:hypothetical protein WCLP8_680004 [uncultured Gammaproteobacteria bacterium]
MSRSGSNDGFTVWSGGAEGFPPARRCLRFIVSSAILTIPNHFLQDNKIWSAQLATKKCHSICYHKEGL